MSKEKTVPRETKLTKSYYSWHVELHTTDGEEPVSALVRVHEIHERVLDKKAKGKGKGKGRKRTEGFAKVSAIIKAMELFSMEGYYWSMKHGNFERKASVRDRVVFANENEYVAKIFVSSPLHSYYAFLAILSSLSLFPGMPYRAPSFPIWNDLRSSIFGVPRTLCPVGAKRRPTSIFNVTEDSMYRNISILQRPASSAFPRRAMAFDKSILTPTRAYCRFIHCASVYPAQRSLSLSTHWHY